MDKILYITLGLIIGISGSYIFAIELKKEVTPADYKYNQYTEVYKNVSKDTLFLIKENYNNTQEILRELKIIANKL